MRRIVFLTLSLLLSVTATYAQNGFLSTQKRIQEIFTDYRETIVRVKAYHLNTGESANSQQEVSFKSGTGFFISKEGHILANANSVRGAASVMIEYKGTEYHAEVLGSDSQVNVALLKTSFLPGDVDFLRMNESPAIAEAGTFALSITCPYDFAPSPKLAMVTGHDTEVQQVFFPTTYLRIDTTLRPGEAGSPIFDLQGRLIGMMVATLPQAQSSYALPSKAINKIKNDLIAEGNVVYAGVGFEVSQDFTRDLKSYVRVDGFSKDSPAKEAGILEGDVIVKVGDFPISDLSDFPNAMFFTRVGEYVNIEVARDDEKFEFNVPTIRLSPDERFVKIQPMTQEEAEELSQGQATPPATTAGDMEDEPAPTSGGASTIDSPIRIPLSPQEPQPGPMPKG